MVDEDNFVHEKNMDEDYNDNEDEGKKFQRKKISKIEVRFLNMTFIGPYFFKYNYIL